MFKKLLSLYLLCFFNLDVVLGEYLTQWEIENLLATNIDNIKATMYYISLFAEHKEMSDFWVPDEDVPIVRSNIIEYVSFAEMEADDEPVPIFYEEPKDEEQKDPCIYQRTIMGSTYGHIILNNEEAVKAWVRVSKGKDVVITETVVSEPPRKTRRPSPPQESFVRCSRSLESLEPEKSRMFKEAYKAIFRDSGVPNVCVIEYESILESLGPESKEEADKLMKSLTGDQKYLREVIESKWFNSQKPILVKIKVKSMPEETCTEIFYEPFREISDAFINQICNTFGHKENVYSQTLILALLLLENLRFVIDNMDAGGYYTPGNETINLNFSKGILSRRVIYHELNHALHYRLGIIGAFFETDENCNALQKELFFRNSEKSIISEKSYRVKPDWFMELFGLGRKVVSGQSVTLRTLYRALEIVLLWGNSEECWNSVGFMQIGDTIYINRLSDIKFQWGPGIFYPTPVVINDRENVVSIFYDFIQKCCHSLLCNCRDYLKFEKFCYELEGKRDTLNMDIIPSDESLRMLLFLHNRTQDKVCFKINKKVGKLSSPLWESLEFN